MFEEFKLPIQIENNNKIQSIDRTIVKDLELLETQDPSNDSVYEICFQPQTIFGKKTLTKWSKQTSSRKKYLQHFQKFIKKKQIYM